jgi:pimeloyl-ACP methyl ester carboxylesterase/DNA-binding SARP family transcriptional activator
VRIEVRMLGGFEVLVDGEPVPESAWPRPRAADLVKLLALAPRHRMARDEVIETLWPHLGVDAGAASLHKATHYARRALGHREAVVVGGGALALAPDGEVMTDVARLEAGDEELLGLELLPDDRYEDWTQAPREHLRERSLEHLRRLGRWEDILAIDPADEQAHRELMRAHAEASDRGAAARQFRRLEAELAELGLRPSPETVRLYRSVARGPAVVAALSEGEADDAHPNALASLVDGLHGRARGATVLVHGGTGSGKTRLGEAVLADAASRGWHTLRASAAMTDGVAGLQVALAAIEPLLAERPDLLAHLPDATGERLGALTDATRAGAGAAAPSATVTADDPAPDGVAIAQLLTCAARERGCAILLDDLHEAGDGIETVLGTLARAAVRHPLLVIAAWRPAEADAALNGAAASLTGKRLARRVLLRQEPELEAPRTRYVRSARRVHVAYQVVGEGDVDIVLTPGFVSNVEHCWELPVARDLFARLLRHGRLVVWDKPGTGLSDPAPTVPTLDDRLTDLAAVTDAAGSRRVIVVGISEGGPLAVAYAAREPERVAGIVLYGATPRFMRAPDFPEGWTDEAGIALQRELIDGWGEGSGMRWWLADLEGDAEAQEAWGRYQRAGASPSMAGAVLQAVASVDVRPLLGEVAAPALVVHRTGDPVIPVQGARLMAQAMPHAELVELPGRNHFPFLGRMDDAWDAIEQFLARAARASGS